MKTRTEIENEIKALQAQLDAMPDEWPQKGDDYHTISSCGEHWTYAFTGDCDDKGRKLVGNLFRTEEEAKRKRTIDIAMTRLRRMQNGWVPDWSSVGELKHTFWLDDGEWRLSAVCLLNFPTWVYYRTPEERDAAFATLTDEEKDALIKGVPV